MNDFERVAASIYLCDWPEDMSFQTLIESCQYGEDLITVWEPFENYPGSFIAECITDLKETLSGAFELKISSTRN